jgi:hypothetical protein
MVTLLGDHVAPFAHMAAQQRGYAAHPRVGRRVTGPYATGLACIASKYAFTFASE